MYNATTGVAGNDVLSVLEAAFRAGLLEIKRIRAAKEPETTVQLPKLTRKDAPRSRTGNAIDILTQASRPLHIHEILEQLEQRGLPATRDRSLGNRSPTPRAEVPSRPWAGSGLV
jgi:hypothetical protein